MDKYPHLARMGVQHPAQVKHYMVNSLDNVDVLRIVYRRDEGSILPESRIYRFPRVQRDVSAGGDKKRLETVMETNPDLRAAIEELKQIHESCELKQTVKEDILEQVRHLEEEIALRAACIRKLTEDL